MENKRFLTAQDVMEMLDVSLSYAYKLIQRLNAELESEGFVTIRKQKTKRGFAKKSEALEWERNFKLKENQSISMSFQSFVDIYLTDLEPRIKRNTFLTKKHIIETKILPYFGK